MQYVFPQFCTEKGAPCVSLDKIMDHLTQSSTPDKNNDIMITGRNSKDIKTKVIQCCRKELQLKGRYSNIK